MFRKSRVNRLMNKIDCSIKDGKIEADDLLEQQ